MPPSIKEEKEMKDKTEVFRSPLDASAQEARGAIVAVTNAEGERAWKS